MGSKSPTRTSRTHPLQIVFVSAGDGCGRIGITFCPGKVQADAFTGAWSRDLETDVAAIAATGAAVVVTLIEDHEIATLQVAKLGATVRRHHMDWLHLPITDVSVPGPDFEAAWGRAGASLRHRLRAGFDVVVHCKGGLGRAGTIAARLMVELGAEPAEAVAQVRAVRPGALETGGQVDHVMALRPVAETATDATDAAIRDRAIGSLLGLAVGDAIGTTLEFAPRPTKPVLTDMIGGGPFKLQPGQWTDDTAMALALADSLAHDPALDATDLMTRFVAWWQTGAYSCTGTCFDIGTTTAAALRSFERNGMAYAGSIDPRSAGNGSLMRLAPVAIRHWRDRAELLRVASEQSRTTHAAPEAVVACTWFADMLADAIAGESVVTVLRQRTFAIDHAITAIATGSWRGKHRDDIRSSGYVAHSLEAALWCVGRTGDFASAVLLAANLGDDADTVAAITGQLAGAIYGLSGIPLKWLERLAWRDRLVAAAEALL